MIQGHPGGDNMPRQISQVMQPPPVLISLEHVRQMRSRRQQREALRAWAARRGTPIVAAGREVPHAR